MTTRDVDAMAQFIRSIDGRNSMGAGALAERICEWLATQPDDATEAPIDMVLHCPKCGMQHIDAPEQNDRYLARSDPPAAWAMPPWKNEPHRSHLCHGCGHIWRPADVPTNGVTAVKTKGKNDKPIAAPAASGMTDAEIEGVIRANLGSGDMRNLIAIVRAALDRAAKKEGGAV